jgi:hypothetical protein
MAHQAVSLNLALLDGLSKSVDLSVDPAEAVSDALAVVSCAAPRNHPA